MKVVLTGSLGSISKPLATNLVANSHAVTVISSKANRQKEIESLGAKAAIGTINDVTFLTKTFTGADIVYLMEPPVGFFHHSIDVTTVYAILAQKYVQAVQQSGVTKVVHLSSVGAHTDKGNGVLRFHHDVENILKELATTVSIKTMRPVGFYQNMFGFIPSIKKANAIIQNYSGDKKEPWASPLDIAESITEEIGKPFNGSTFKYIASDEVSPDDVAKIIGAAIGRPDLKWLAIPDETFESNLINIGFNPKAAKGLTEMNAARVNGILYEDYNRHKPILGKVKLSDFAKEFSIAYNSTNN